MILPIASTGFAKDLLRDVVNRSAEPWLFDQAGRSQSAALAQAAIAAYQVLDRRLSNHDRSDHSGRDPQPDFDRGSFLALSQSSQRATPRTLKILLMESEPIAFLAAFIAGVTAGCSLFLGNPAWRDRERQAAIDLIQPDWVWENLPLPAADPVLPAIATVGPSPESLARRASLENPKNTIAIATGGSSGQLRFAVHTWESLWASAVGFGDYFDDYFGDYFFDDYFGETAGDDDRFTTSRFTTPRFTTFCTLPLFHVSGLMQFVRAIALGGEFSWGRLPIGQDAIADRPNLPMTKGFLSLVPTQLVRLLAEPESIAWLRGFRVVLLGGAPAWPDLLDRARSAGIRLAPTYGMTETASQVATLRPEDFLAGHTGVGQALPHAQITILDPNGQAVRPGEVGTIAILGRSLFQGYWPLAESGIRAPDQPWRTDDLGYFDRENRLHVVGRSSRKIITGGENVYPDEVAAALWATGRVADVAVFGVADAEWGERVVAAIVPKDRSILTSPVLDPSPSLEPGPAQSQPIATTDASLDSKDSNVDPADRTMSQPMSQPRTQLMTQLITQLKTELQNHLSAYKIPKQWCVLSDLPRNDRGKVDQHQLLLLSRGEAD